MAGKISGLAGERKRREKRLQRSRLHPPLPGRLVITDLARGLDPLAQAAILSAGDALIFRHYEWDRTQRESTGKILRIVCREKKALFLVAGCPRLARALRADGLHLPRWQLARGWNRRGTIPPGWLVSAAVHNRAELHAAENAGADMALLSPIFPTASHKGEKTLGSVQAAGLVSVSTIPVYGLGGINAITQKRVRHIGFCGFAGSSPGQ